MNQYRVRFSCRWRGPITRIERFWSRTERILMAGALAGLVALTAPASALTINSVSQSGTQIGLHQPLTIRFGLSRTYSNPYDPALIDARFEFTGPSGAARVIPAFYTGESPAWMARIVPLELGAHTCRLLANDHTGEAAVHTLQFTAVASTARGFVRIDPRNPRYLRFDNGQPYRPVGHNVCWGGRESLFYTWLDRMAAAGENWTRYWMVPYVGQGIEWGGGVSGATLGRYSQYQSQMFDSMLAGARDRGIQVQLCLDSFTGWNIDLYANWDANIYNTANGGMCGRPNDYFINAQAKAYAKRLLRYVVARWGYNTGILCWEFFNEVDAVGGYGATFWGHEQEIADWHREMAQYVRSIDPFRHLITTSFADGGPRSAYAIFWQMPEMEIVQVHRYSILVPEEHISLIRNVYSFGKPVIMGEGTNAGQPHELETSGGSIHALAWAGAVEQSGVMPWWWDGWIHPNNLYWRFTPVVNYLANEDWAPQNLGQLSASLISGPSGLRLFGASGPRHAYMYLRGLSDGINGVRVRLNSLTAGTYNIEFWNTSPGAVISTTTITTAGAPTLDMPTFHYDLAVKIKIISPSLRVTPSNLSAAAATGTNPPASSIFVSNGGSEVLHYTIADDAGWLTTEPAAGSSTGEEDVIAVQYNTVGLLAGVHTATITVTDTSGASAPRMVEVTLTLTSSPGDFDGDADVDQEDFGRLQVCLSGSGIMQSNPACLAADLDDDNDVDQTDLNLLAGCMSGPNSPAEPDCAG